MNKFTKRLGLFGGRFDPVHKAHISVAVTAANQLKLKEINWIVSGRPVQKKPVVSAFHRVKMVSIALRDLGDKRMRIDSREVISSINGENNPTYKTIESIKRDYPDTELIWILGHDQLLNFQSWLRWQWLIKNMKLAVCSRNPNNDHNSKNLIDDNFFRLIPKKRLIWIKITPNDCSSTKIRKLISEDSSILSYVNRNVRNYILENKLYKKIKEDGDL